MKLPLCLYEGEVKVQGDNRSPPLYARVRVEEISEEMVVMKAKQKYSNNQIPIEGE